MPDTQDNKPDGGLDKPSDTASVGGNQVDKLSELLVKLRDSLEPTDFFHMGWFKDAWFINVELDNSIKSRPLTPNMYGRTGDTPLLAVQNLVVALNQDKVTDLQPSDSKPIHGHSKAQKLEDIKSRINELNKLPYELSFGEDIDTITDPLIDKYVDDRIATLEDEYKRLGGADE